jgi:soluble cytochrome b562
VKDIRQVFLAKQIYQESERLIERSSVAMIGLAICTAQDAVELFLRSVIKEHDIAIRDQDGFTVLLDAIDKAAASDQMKVPFRAKVLELNKARVAFKHYGLAPELAASRRLVAYASDFFAEACQRFFGFDFAELSLVDEVQNDVVRSALKRAEQAIEQGELREAQCATAEAVHWSSNS